MTGVYFPCLKECKTYVGEEKTVPFAVLCAAHEEYTYWHAAENDIVLNIYSI